MTSRAHDRRGFLHGILAAGAVTAAGPVRMDAQAQPQARELTFLPPYAARAGLQVAEAVELRQDRRQQRSLADRAPAASQEVFNATGPGVITHIWFTIAARSDDHLKEIVLRGYWDGNAKPSVEVPVGDFFGLNLGALPDLPVASTSPARPAAR